MALSGTVDGKVTQLSSYFSFYFTWSATQSESGNYSDVTVTTYWKTNNIYQDFDTVGKRNSSITINGETSSQEKVHAVYWSSVGNPYAIQTAKTRVYHNDDGSKSITISVRANGHASGYGPSSNLYESGDCTASATITLDTIPRKPDVPTVSSPTTSTVGETITSLTVKWAKSNRGTYTVEVSKNGGAYSSVEDEIALATLSYTYTVKPSQGDTYRFRVKAVYNGLSSDYSYSGTVTLNKLTAPTIANIGTYNPYVTSALSVSLSGGSQTNGGKFKRMADLYYGSTKLASCTTPSDDNTSVSITYAPASYASKIGKTKYSDTFKIVAWTQNSNGSKSSTTTKEFTVDLNSDKGATPTLNEPVLSGGFSGYSSTCFVAGVHNLIVTSGSASANRAPSGTTLSYKIECTGFSSVNSNTATFTKPTSGKKTIKVTVTDSRGLSTTKTVYCRFQSWTKPTVKIISAERDETTPSTIKVSYEIRYTEIYDTYGANADIKGNNINTITSQQYTTSSTYNNCGNPFTITGTNTELSYTITVRASDKISPSVYGSSSKIVGTVNKYISMRSHGIGLNCVPISGYVLDVNGPTRIGNSNGYMLLNGGNINTTGNIVSANLKAQLVELYFATNTSTTMYIRNRTVVKIFLALNGNAGYIEDTLYINDGKIVSKITGGTARSSDYITYSYDGTSQILTMTCSLNWCAGYALAGIVA